MTRVACPDCTKSCIRLHQSSEKDPKPTRFIKVVFGKDHMELPFGFAYVLEDMAGEDFKLEDAEGSRQWPVKLLHAKGLLAFTTGWSSFFDDHHLEEGNFLSFEYMEGTRSFSFRLYAKDGSEAINRTGREVSTDTNGATNDNSSAETNVPESNLNEAVFEMGSPARNQGTSGDKAYDEATEKNINSRAKRRIFFFGISRADDDRGPKKVVETGESLASDVTKSKGKEKAQMAEEDHTGTDCEIDRRQPNDESFNKTADCRHKPKKRKNDQCSRSKRPNRRGRTIQEKVDGGGARTESPIVEVEPDLQQNVTFRTFSVVVKSREFLELPKGSRHSCKCGHVMYLEAERSSVRTLTAFWDKFCVKNGVVDGTICKFDLHNDRLPKSFRVHVEHMA